MSSLLAPVAPPAAAPEPEPTRQRVDFHPLQRLSDLNIEDELLQQFNRAKRLLTDAEYDESVPLNQKAQTLNSATTILQQITKMQSDLYDSERVKMIEQILLATLRKFPEMQADFLRTYKAYLNA